MIYLCILNLNIYINADKLYQSDESSNSNIHLQCIYIIVYEYGQLMKGKSRECGRVILYGLLVLSNNFYFGNIVLVFILFVFIAYTCMISTCQFNTYFFQR